MRKQLLALSAYTLILMLSASAYFTLYYIFVYNFYFGLFILGLVALFVMILVADGDIVRDMD